MDYQENTTRAAGIEQAVNARRAAMNGGDEGACLAQGPLDSIVDRIDRATTAAQEIGHKLNDHADRVHGPSGTKTLSGGIERADTVRERPLGAMSRIFEALGNLDHAQNYLAEAAERNSTLA